MDCEFDVLLKNQSAEVSTFEVDGNQGYLIHPRTEGKGEPRGEGFELRTDEAGSLRAGKGLLISTDARHNATGRQLDRQELSSQLKAATDLADTLGDNAAHQLANRTETGRENQLIKDDKAPGNPSKTGLLAPVQI
jgi:type VI secretion system secreted protein VgrG